MIIARLIWLVLPLHFTEAHKYFVEFISKAYQALTDPISRENYEKYGHPDGRQVMLFYLFCWSVFMDVQIHG